MAYEKKYDKPFVYKPYPDGGTLRASQTKTHEKSSDYWGDLAINMKDLTNINVIDGLTVIRINGWKKKDTNGKTYLSLAVSRYIPQEEGGTKGAPRRQENKVEDDSDFPF
jgi:hypothetical protein